MAEEPINDILHKLLQLDPNADEEIIKLLKTVRLLLTKSSANQNAVVSNEKLVDFLRATVFNISARTDDHRLKHTIALQVLANACVNNEFTQHAIWTTHGKQIIEHVALSPPNNLNNILLMIIYNIYLNNQLIDDQSALESCVRLWKVINDAKSTYEFEYLHFFLEHFIVHNGRKCVACYQHLSVEDRISFLDYIAHYLREDSPNGELHQFLLQHFAKEFKLKSDCILRETIKLRHELHPREVHTLLRILASISGSEKYGNTYASDHSLFINVSSLLRCVVAAGKESDGGGLDKPMTKLEEVAITSNIDADYESKVSYELKTLLVRCIANLLYDNKTNKGYCLDTQLLPALLDCTIMDARNPLMREWSILAIRNACINCPEAQQVIGGLTMQGAAPNDILSELNLELGALRITDKQQRQQSQQ